MSKLRVYELAKELNMNSAELVDRLRDFGFEITNYMSALDKNEVIKAKECLSGETSEIFEEKRIKPTVIRRRKKIIPKAQEFGEVEEPPSEEVKDKVFGESEQEDFQKSVEKPVEELVVKTAEEAFPETADEPVQETPEEPVGIKEITSPVLQQEAKELAKEKIEHKAEEESIAKEPVRRTSVKAEKKKKEKPKDVPARIIKRPDVISVETKQEQAVTLREVGEAAVIDEEQKKEKPVKKKRREEKEEEQNKKDFHRKKREIFEREDLYGDFETRFKVKGRLKKKGQADKKVFKQTEITVPKAIKRKIKVPGVISIFELAKHLGIKAAELIRKLREIDVIANINQSIDFDSASLVTAEFGYELELQSVEADEILSEEEDRIEDLLARPPVITVMGHVDHGKTSILDYIRKTRVIEKEAGGITQHIGAYFVQTPKGSIVFLDTPGHEAFTAMRARGAKVTDIIVLVVAADDGVKEQTVEAINHARAAKVPIIVAINKIDKPNADIERVKRELAKFGLLAEDWGGEVLFSTLSAKTGEGIDELLDDILLQSEMMELKANYTKKARGSIVEARLDKTRGPVATILVRKGELKQGDFFVCGETYGRVRAMHNDRGQKIESASPSMPVEVYGISEVPKAGDDFVVIDDEKKARLISERRKDIARIKASARAGSISLDNLFDKIKEGEIKELNLILKADVQGSLEALNDSISKLGTEEVKVKVIHGATGAVTENDVMLASASEAIIICFNVRAGASVRSLAERENVDIRYYDVIYKVLEDINSAMVGLLEPVYSEEIIGHVLVKQVFHISKIGTIAGCYVNDGKVERGAKTRLLRDGVVVFDGKVGSLKRFKDDAKEVASGFECGLGLENYNDIKPNDVLEIYTLKEVKPEL